VPRTGLSRRQLLTRGATIGAAVGLGGGLPFHGGGVGQAEAATVAGDRAGRKSSPDLVLFNGRIHTMDAGNRVVSSVLIRNGRFLEVGGDPGRDDAHARRINLRGRTVLPGLVDTHNHIVLFGLRPGYHTPLENAYSIADAQDVLAARRPAVPDGGWVTTIGGFNPSQFAENRLPTRGELDDAVPDRPVFVQVSFAGPSTTNSEGKAFFESKGVPVGDDGSIASGNGLVGTSPSQLALYHLRQMQTFEDQKRGTADAMAYAGRVGVTTHLDQGAWPSGASCNNGSVSCGCAEYPVDCGSSPDDGAAHADEYLMHRPFVDLHREGRMTVRVRTNFLEFEADPALPRLRARLNNTWPFFGSDLLQTGGIGEIHRLRGGHAAPPGVVGGDDAGRTGALAQREPLDRGAGLPDDHRRLGAGQRACPDHRPALGARAHSLHHRRAPRRLKALGCGVNLSGFTYFGAGTGPPYRRILDSGIRAAAGGDGMQIAPMNPFIHLYHATTGRNARGQLGNDGQQISRVEALRLWTSATPWFFNDEPLGTIETGKYADLIVLNGDYFTVPDHDLRKLRSVLTVVDGNVVHDEGALR
jgi:predicted amidohydrolase YtcJ